MDDYAWENNLAAFRLYGPALEKIMVSNGIDYWAKSTPNLVIDDWYKKDLGGEGSYHLDTGRGLRLLQRGPDPRDGRFGSVCGRQIVVQPQLQRGRDARQRADPHYGENHIRPVRRGRSAGVAGEDHFAGCEYALQPDCRYLFGRSGYALHCCGDRDPCRSRTVSRRVLLRAL